MDEGKHHKAMRISIGAVGRNRVAVFVGNMIDTWVRGIGSQNFDPIA
jgi:hypothetical protein